MKLLSLSLAGVSVVQLVAAQPHWRHQHRHVQRDTVVEEYVVDAPAKIVVYVDENNAPLSTTTLYDTPSEPTKVAAPAEQPPAEQQKKEADQAAPESYQTPATQEQASEPIKPAAQPEGYAPEPSPASTDSQTSQSGSGGSGITYTPYNDDDSCKSGDQVMSDFAKISGYAFVRIYGTDCNQLDTVLPAAKSRGMKVFAGIDERNVTSDAALQAEVDYLARAAGGDMSIYETVSVCNECVHRGSKDAGFIASAVNKVRDMLKSKGYGGPVVTVETAGAMRNNPGLCEASSYAACNIHAFFNKDVSAADAGKFVAQEAKLVAEACKGKRVVVTETGWPSGGNPNGAAVPSPENQQAAIESLKQAFSENPANIIYFSAFNEGWKEDRADTFGCEKFYGILN